MKTVNRIQELTVRDRVFHIVAVVILTNSKCMKTVNRIQELTVRDRVFHIVAVVILTNSKCMKTVTVAGIN
jgi:hypothetical protein